MIFGDTPIAEAEGAILVHSQRVGKRAIKKGRRLSQEDVAALQMAGIETVVTVRLEDGDLHEDDAAARVAQAVAKDNVEVSAAFTGRVNLFAEAGGLLEYDPAVLNELNLVDEAITVAALNPFEIVNPKQMVATIKIIPFGAAQKAVDACVSLIEGGLIRVAPFRPQSFTLIQTHLAGTKASVLDKTFEVMQERVAPLQGNIDVERRCAHDVDALCDEIRAHRGRDAIFITGASAITDRRDVIPAAIERAGGVVEHFGMPVDPGNLLLLGRLDGKPVIGLPGCARSPKLNGFDWVLQRLAADVPVTKRDIMQMGVGGLLKEIISRPLPRVRATLTDLSPRAPKIAAIVLAAGQSRRMGAQNKMTVDVDGQPMIARVVDNVLASKATPVTVVLGHEPAAVRKVLTGKHVHFTENASYEQGLSTSVLSGVRALPTDLDGFLVCLGDMPKISAAQINRLIAAFDPEEQRAICVPVFNGKRGNPILFSRQFIEEFEQLKGDKGARFLLDKYPELTCDVDMQDDSVLVDVDTPDALSKLAI